MDVLSRLLLPSHPNAQRETRVHCARNLKLNILNPWLVFVPVSLQWRTAAKLCQVLYQQTSSSHPVHSAKCDNFSQKVTPDRIIDGHVANQILLRGNRWDTGGINQLSFIGKTKSLKKRGGGGLLEVTLILLFLFIWRKRKEDFWSRWLVSLRWRGIINGVGFKTSIRYTVYKLVWLKTAALHCFLQPVMSLCCYEQVI